MPMLLDLMRHGAAEPSHPLGDANRTLSAAGREDVRRLGERLRRGDWAPDQTWASPYARAQETARLLLEAAGRPPDVGTMDELEPDSEPASVLAAIEAGGRANGHLLLVTHMPLIGLLTRRLANRDVAFAPGAMVRITLPAGLRGSGAIANDV